MWLFTLLKYIHLYTLCRSKDANTQIHTQHMQLNTYQFLPLIQLNLTEELWHGL